MPGRPQPVDQQSQAGTVGPLHPVQIQHELTIIGSQVRVLRQETAHGGEAELTAEPVAAPSLPFDTGLRLLLNLHVGAPSC